MPEHRDGTPTAFRGLESFLWHDFEDGSASWLDWLRHRHLRTGEMAASASFAAAMRLHVALRTLQAANANLPGGPGDDAFAHGTLNALTEQHEVRPFVGVGGSVCLAPSDGSNPAALLLIEALEAMRLGFWRRFKLCRKTTCRASFYDVSKSVGKVWCEMGTCGTQNKMRRYRAKSGGPPA